MDLKKRRSKGLWRYLPLLLIMFMIMGMVPLVESETGADINTPTVAITPMKANANGYYNGDVPVGISVKNTLSGIQEIEYRITSKGQETVPWQVLYTCMEGEEIEDSREESICVDAEANDSADVKVWVRVTSQDGSVYTTEEKEACSLKICTAKPVVEVAIGGTLHEEAKKGYYNAVRKATVTIIDRADVFDPEAATNAIRVGKNGGQPSVQPAMVSAWTDTGDRHSAVVTFAEDGAYTWEVSAYTNQADLSSSGASTEGDSPYTFTVDTEAPLTSDTPDRNVSWIGFGETGWSKLAASLTFRSCERKAVSVAAEGKDATSPVYPAKYYKTAAEEAPALRADALEVLYKSGAFAEYPYTVEEDGQFVIYARITDYAGNTAYISTDGIIVDRTAGEVTLRALEPANAAGFYSDDVVIDVRVNDLLEGKTACSGIQSVDYEIKNPVTQYAETGNLYTFGKKNPSREELLQEWEEKDLTVDAGTFDAAGILVTVKAVDRAGNECSGSMSLNICRNAPEVTVEFQDTAEREADGRGYFGQARKAVVTVRDRADVFDAEAAEITANAMDASGTSIPLEEAAVIGAWSHEGNIHTAALTFAADGNYDFSFSYRNRADLPAKVSYVGSTPQKFTVDTTVPEGSVTIKDSTWRELLSVLTFGLYSSTELDVTAAAEDATSPVFLEYYKTDNPVAMTAAQLDRQTFVPFPEKGVAISKDEQLAIYLKVTDYAGNYVYVSSDGYIVDMTRSGISLTPITADHCGIYNQDVEVAVRIHEPDPYSGIKTIRYEVTARGELTQGGTLYAFGKERPLQSELTGDWEGSVTIASQKNNSCDVVLSVFAEDNAGNVSQESLPLDIDITCPSVKIVYMDDDAGSNGNGYFSAPRTAVVTITERTHHFDSRAAAEGIQIKAVDAAGRKVRIDRESMLTDWMTEEGKTPDEAVHRAVLTCDTDANYTVSISYTDRAGNSNTVIDTGDSDAPWKFTVDTTAPTGSVTAKRTDGTKGTRTKTWENTLEDYLRFGFWSGKTITVTGKASDETSPIAGMFYYKTSRGRAMTEQELKNLPAGEWKEFAGKKVKIVPNEQAVLYVKITDKAGNVSYISSGGMIADKDKPRVESFAPQITIRPEQPVNGFYKDDVKVKLAVSDFEKETGEPYSGLKTIRYEVLNMGERTQGGIKEENPEGVLYSFQKGNPRKKALKKSWSGTITVDSRKNNSNQVVIKLYAEDNAGNVTTSKRTMKIDTTPPQISISYNNNSPDSGRYYSSDRTATITVTERNFDEKDVVAAIKNSEGDVPSVTGWREVKGTGNGDDTKYTAVLTYHADGDYTFAIGCTDLAGNRCPGAVYAPDTKNPTDFTIDQTAPVIAVSYDNNHAQNKKYFKESRTATVTITEHNFDENRVKFEQTASLDGNHVAIPQASWSGSGDVHTAVFSYTADGDYTFAVSMEDLAGNPDTGVSYGDSAAGTEFTVDTHIEKPEITGVKSGKSYKGEVLPSIRCADVNFAKEEIQLLRTRKDEKDLDVTEEFITGLQRDRFGASGVSDTFEKEAENDGIYTLIVKISDLAGNESAETVTFTVNRFGSVYAFDDYLISLKDTYTRKVERKLTITEYNPDRLVKDSLEIQITRDGVPLDDVKYTVTPVLDDRVKTGESGWYQYQYEIGTENFMEDGIYKLSVLSEDMAGNKPEITNAEAGNIMFRVDTTPPEITDIRGLGHAIINAESQNVDFDIFDAIGLKRVTVSVDGLEAGSYESFEDLTQHSGSVTIREGADQHVRLVAEDLAGNITDTDGKEESGRYIFQPEFAFVRDITVSTSAFVRWHADKRIFWGTVGGAAAALLIFVLTKRRKRKKKMKCE